MSNVHFIIDEAASLGHMESIDDGVDKFRGYGIRLQFYFQSLGQLKKCFPENQEQTLLSNTTQIFFGVNDNQTADFVSARIGEGTIVVTSGGTSSGSSTNWSSGMQPQHGGGGSYNASHNWQQQARKLLKPEEVMMLDPRTAITFAPGVPPIATRLARYYEEPRIGQSPGWIRRINAACAIFTASFAFCLAMLVFAAGLTALAYEQISMPHATTIVPWQEF
jgi:type IV secretion system protein VirD4